MIAVTSLLVLASAVAINALALQNACNNIQMGDLSGTPTPLEISYLSSGVADWEVSVPDVPGCPNGAAGVAAVVCDVDVTPTATFANKNLIMVHRNGQLQGTGSVLVTVYCASQWPLNKLWLPSNQLPSPLNQLSAPLNQLWPPSNKLLNSQNVWDQPPQSLWDQPPQNLWNQPQQKLLARPQ